MSLYCIGIVLNETKRGENAGINSRRELFYVSCDEASARRGHYLPYDSILEAWECLWLLLPESIPQQREKWPIGKKNAVIDSTCCASIPMHSTWLCVECSRSYRISNIDIHLGRPIQKCRILNISLSVSSIANWNRNMTWKAMSRTTLLESKNKPSRIMEMTTNGKLSTRRRNRSTHWRTARK
jgi:hypothetical protein